MPKKSSLSLKNKPLKLRKVQKSASPSHNFNSSNCVKNVSFKLSSLTLPLNGDRNISNDYKPALDNSIGNRYFSNDISPFDHNKTKSHDRYNFSNDNTTNRLKSDRYVSNDNSTSDCCDRYFSNTFPDRYDLKNGDRYFSNDNTTDEDDLEDVKPVQRNAANARERARMRILSKAFFRLKTTLPWVSV